MTIGNTTLEADTFVLGLTNAAHDVRAVSLRPRGMGPFAADSLGDVYAIGDYITVGDTVLPTSSRSSLLRRPACCGTAASAERTRR